MRRNRIILTPDRAFRVEGIIGAGLTLSPGSAVQVQIAAALQGGRHTWEVYNPTADGMMPVGPIIILEEDLAQSRDALTPYTAGTRAFGSILLPGCEFNGLLLNLAGTADDHPKGE